MRSVPKILVVDDDPLNRMVIAKIILNDFDVDIVEAASGSEAIDLIRTGQPPSFSLVLLDINMPGLDGWQTTIQLKLLQSEGDFPDLGPIIAHTAVSSQQDHKKCFQCGMEFILPKPTTRDAMILMFSKLLPTVDRKL